MGSTNLNQGEYWPDNSTTTTDDRLARASEPVRRLYCTCCGGVFQGRQFHNQDIGHGMGECCAERVLNHRPFGHDSMGVVEFERTYGVRGYHFALSDLSECPDCGGIGADHHAGCDSKHLTISQQARTILADTDDALSADINLVALTALAARELLNGYDYKNQAWVRNGRYVRCGHPASMNCGCYGLTHQGELVAPGVEVQ